MRALAVLLVCTVAVWAQMWPNPGPGRASTDAGGNYTFTYVSSNSIYEGGSDTDVAVTISGFTATNTAVCVVSFEDAATTATISVSDGSGGLTGFTKRVHSAQNLVVQTFWIGSAASGTFTATFSEAVGVKGIHCYEYSTDGGTVAAGQENVAESNGGTTSVTSGNVTTTEADSVGVAGARDYNVGAYSAQQINGVAADNTISTAGGTRSWDDIKTATFTGQATATSTGATWICTLSTIKVS